MSLEVEVLFDAAEHGLHTAMGTHWRFVADTVMGGRSRGLVELAVVGGRPAVRLDGVVSLENGGGFIQVNADLAASGRTYDASRGVGFGLEAAGDGGAFHLLVKTADLDRPWQSYRARFELTGAWSRVEISFDRLEPHGTDRPFDARRVVRVGIAALRREGPATLALARLTLLGAPRGASSPVPPA